MVDLSMPTQNMRHVRERRGSSWLARLVRAAAMLMIAGCAVPFVARALGIESGPLAVLVALSPWVPVALIVPLVLATLTRSLDLIVLALVPALVSATWQLPLYAGGHEGESMVTVATVNAAVGGVDAADIMDLVAEHDVDLLTVQELTPELARDLEQAEIDHWFWFSAQEPGDGAAGIGVWTRLPVADSRALGGFALPAFELTVDVYGMSTSVVALHTAAPGLRDHELWAQDLARLEEVAGSLNGPAIVLGDLNATRDHVAFQRLEDRGFVDAADDAGIGFAPTFPEGRGVPFPLVAIDHVLARDLPLVPSDVLTIPLDGSDHRALVVTYAVPEER